MNRIIYFSLSLLFVLFSLSANSKAQELNGRTNSVCRLFADVGNISSVITYIQKDTPVSVQEKYGDYYFIKFDSTGGFVLVKKIDLNNDAVYTEYGSSDDQAEQYDNPDQNISVDRLSFLISKYGERTGKALNDLKIWTGMDHNMVRDSWGKPFSVTRKIEGSTVVEEWFYPATKLIFRNDVLVGWEK